MTRLVPGPRGGVARPGVLGGGWIKAMTPELFAGLLALVGVVIGAGATLATSWTAARVQRSQVAEGRDERQNAVRREAYTEFLAHTTAFLDLARDVCEVLAERDLDTERLTEVHRRYLTEWHALVRSRAAVQIAGPAEAATVAKELQGAVGNASDECDGWRSARLAGRTPRTSEMWGKFEKARDDADGVSDRFASQARDWWRDPYISTKITRSRRAERAEPPP